LSISPASSGQQPSPEGELGTDHLITDLGRRSRRGGAVMMAAQAVRVLVQAGAIIVLARLLPPQAFGLLAMVAALGVILDLAKDLGLSSATIQKADLTEAQISSLFWINVAAGAALALALFLAAPALARFYAQPVVAPVTQWLALGFLMSGLTVQHWALLRRQMRFGAIAAIEVGADLAGFAVAIGLAFAGAGLWALVAQRLVSPGVLLVGSWIVCRWRPGRPAGASGLGGLLRFGAAVTGSGLASALTRSVDQVLIGWLWGPMILGLYERTTRLLLLPINSINAPVYAVGMPALSRLATHPEPYRRAFRQLLQKLALLTMPPFAVICVTADWVVQILFGPSWRQAVPLVQWFAISATYLPVLMAVSLLYLTQDRTAEMLRATLMDSAICIVSILLGLVSGAVGVAAAIAVVGLVVRAPTAFWLSTRQGPVTQRDVYAAVLPAIVAAVIAAACAWALRRFYLADVAVSVSGVAWVALTALGAMAFTLLAFAETRRELMALIRHPLAFRLRRQTAPPS
jgi:PST family polysaccharide transporter